ncbi:MAG: hypothetical protein ACREXM_05730 [Gammaproteobacteria bacterium]
MSLVTEILERLVGIAVLRERVYDTAQRVDRLADWLLDHERRLTQLETLSPGASKSSAKTPRRLPKKQ